MEFRVREGVIQQALTKMRELSQPLGGLLSATGQRTVDVKRMCDQEQGIVESFLPTPLNRVLPVRP